MLHYSVQRDAGIAAPGDTSNAPQSVLMET